ncbi:MAG: hypothetical protein LUD47_05260 [Clostridia bacterium]|nr:hypothetical protein [Clostridia bacterium]
MAKNKKSPQELEEERSARLQTTLDNMNTQLIKLDKIKKTYASKAAEAEARGLETQKQQARSLLKKTMQQEKQIYGMVMSIELAVQTKELSSISEAFLQCMDDISADLSTNTGKVNVKKVQNQFMKAGYAQKQQEERLNQMLDTGDYALLGEMGADEATEFDDDVDAMIRDAAKAVPGGITGTNKNRF